MSLRNHEAGEPPEYYNAALRLPPGPEVSERVPLRQALYYLNAGGLGTRLESVLPKHELLGITKALINFGGEPVLAYHLKRARALGYGGVLVGAGHHEHVVGELSATASGEWQPDKYEIISQAEQYGTGGDLILAVRGKRNEFPYTVVQNVDTLLDVPEERVLQQHMRTGAGATIVLTTNTGVPNEGAYWCAANGKVLYCAEAAPHLRLAEPPQYAYRASSTGMVVVNTELLAAFPWDKDNGPVSLYSHMLGSWVRQGLVYGFNNMDKFFMDIGTPNTYHKVQRHPVLKTILEHRASQTNNEQ